MAKNTILSAHAKGVAQIRIYIPRKGWGSVKMDVGTQTIVSWIEEQVNVEETPLEATDNSIDKQDSNEGTTDGNKEGEIEEEARLQELAATLSESSSSEDEREDDEEEGKEYKPVSVNVPWPAVLQYMRETDSESSKYFGLGKNRTKIITDEQEERNEEELCQFCGEALKHLSLLPDSLEKVKYPYKCNISILLIVTIYSNFI